MVVAISVCSVVTDAPRVNDHKGAMSALEDDLALSSEGMRGRPSFHSACKLVLLN